MFLSFLIVFNKFVLIYNSRIKRVVFTVDDTKQRLYTFLMKKQESTETKKTLFLN